MNRQDYERIPRRSVLLGCALLTAVGAVYGLAEPASAQLTGTWDIIVNGCCDDDETSCPEEFTFVVTQSGNGLSGSLFLPEEIPLECEVTCMPATPNCDRRIDLVGTVSGNSVDVTFSSDRLVNASCQICQVRCVNCTFQEHIQTTDRLNGTVAGSTITGSWTNETDDTCETGGDPVCGLITCEGSTCSGTFEVAIREAPTPGVLVCDVAPSTGDALGQFGNNVINNSDVVAVFRASLLGPPASSSARFNAMDSIAVDNPPMCGGDNSIKNNDVVACFKRSLIPTEPKYTRTISTGPPLTCTSAQQ